eukprot:962828-Pyramimonas_sp.AAC.1
MGHAPGDAMPDRFGTARAGRDLNLQGSNAHDRFRLCHHQKSIFRNTKLLNRPLCFHRELRLATCPAWDRGARVRALNGKTSTNASTNDYLPNLYWLPFNSSGRREACKHRGKHRRTYIRPLRDALNTAPFVCLLCGRCTCASSV